MIFKIISVYDQAARAYGRPFYVPHEGVALRSFHTEVNDVKAQSELFRNAVDYDLYELGSFDDSNAIFSCHMEPKLLARGKEVKIPQNLDPHQVES